MQVTLETKLLIELSKEIFVILFFMFTKNNVPGVLIINATFRSIFESIVFYTNILFCTHYKLESNKDADIKLAQRFDYERNTQYSLIVRVQNKYQLVAETVVFRCK